MNLAIWNDEIYVADYWNDRIQVFSLSGTPNYGIGEHGDGPGQLNAPGGVAVAPNGDIIVADFYNQRVQRLHRDGSFVRQWGTTGETGVAEGQFNYPTDVAIGRDGMLFVADGYNDRIQVFDADGVYVRRWGGPFGINIFGPFRGWFATVTSIGVADDGNIFVADFYNHRIQKFTPRGTFLSSFGTLGHGDGQLYFAVGVAVAPDGSVFVVDFGNNRIQKWRPM